MHGGCVPPEPWGASPTAQVWSPCAILFKCMGPQAQVSRTHGCCPASRSTSTVLTLVFSLALGAEKPCVPEGRRRHPLRPLYFNSSSYSWGYSQSAGLIWDNQCDGKRSLHPGTLSVFLPLSSFFSFWDWCFLCMYPKLILNPDAFPFHVLWLHVCATMPS